MMISRWLSRWWLVFRTNVTDPLPRLQSAVRAPLWRRWTTWVWLGLMLGLFFCVVLPFLRFNQLTSWDAPGHVDAVWYIRHYVWPFPAGWNSFSFAGYPQGIFYPPFFHYLAAGLSFVVPLLMSVKVLVGVAMMLTPWAFYRYAKSLGHSRETSVVVMTVMTALIVFPFTYSSSNNAIGGTLYSTFNIGLLTNGFVLPLVVVYWSLLHTHLPRGRTSLPTVLLSMVVLTHTYAAMAAAIYVTLFLFAHWQNQSIRFATLRHIGFSMALTAWWWVPFLVFYRYSATIGLPIVLGSFGFAALMAGVGAGAWLLFQQRLNRALLPVAYITFCTVGLAMIHVVHWPIHTYRLMLYPLLMVPVIVLEVLHQRRLRVAVVLMAILALGYAFTRADKEPGFSVRGAKQQAQTAPIDGNFPDRTLILAGLPEQESPHIQQFTWPIRMNQSTVKGLFVESSRSARYLLPLESLLDPTAFLWGIPLAQYQPMPDSAAATIAVQRLRDFGVGGIVSARSLGRYQLKAEREVMQVVLHERFYVARIGSRTFSIPINNQTSYFAAKDGYLFLVSHEGDYTNFQAFTLPGLQAQNVVRIGTTSYFIRRLFDDIYEIDFSLATNKVLVESADLLQPLHRFTTTLPKDQQTAYQQALQHLASQLSTINSSQAQLLYRQASHVTLPNGTVTRLRNAELEYTADKRTYHYWFYPLQKTELVTALPRAPEAIDRNWQVQVDQWMYDLKDRTTLIRTTSAPAYHPSQVQGLEAPRQQNRVSFTINASQPAPVAVHISYFPKWRAYQDGQRIPVYQASPNIMIVYGKGAVELRYETLWFEWAAILVSLASVLAGIGGGCYATVKLSRRKKLNTTVFGKNMV